MRGEQEMYDAILGFAKRDGRVRAVLLNGSRADPNAPRDSFQDYDIVYIVRDIEGMIKDQDWLEVFGTRLITQTPETMRGPCGDGRFTWLMLFEDFNRIDLTLIPEEKPHLLGHDSLTKVLLDKGGAIGALSLSCDADCFVKAPDALNFYSCCNNFFWCLQNVAKGIARDELAYAMMMYHTVVRGELHDMISWYIGAQHGFAISAGKMGKYFKRYLPGNLYAMYEATFSDAKSFDFIASVYAAAELFRQTAKIVADCMGYVYNQSDDNGIMKYIAMVRNLSLGSGSEEE